MIIPKDADKRQALKGRRVALTPAGKQIHGRRKDRQGEIVGFSRTGLYVRVVWDNYTEPVTYSPTFIILIKPHERTN